MPDPIPALPEFNPSPVKTLQQCIDVFVQITKLCKTDFTAKAMATSNLSLVSLITSTGKHFQQYKGKTKALTETDRQSCIKKLNAFHCTFLDEYKKQKTDESSTDRTVDRLLAIAKK